MTSATHTLPLTALELMTRRFPELAAVLDAAIEELRGRGYAGQYYECFAVNSRNFTDLSEGTRDWIRKCERLAAKCPAGAAKSPTSAGAKACGLLVQLLHHVDEGRDDVGLLGPTRAAVGRSTSIRGASDESGSRAWRQQDRKPNMSKRPSKLSR